MMARVLYYGSFKNKMFKPDHEVVKFKSELEMYWKAVVEEAEKWPQLTGATLRICWLFTGTNYRRMVEPPSTINGVTEVTYLRGDQSTSSYWNSGWTNIRNSPRIVFLTIRK